MIVKRLQLSDDRSIEHKAPLLCKIFKTRLDHIFVPFIKTDVLLGSNGNTDRLAVFITYIILRQNILFSITDCKEAHEFF